MKLFCSFSLLALLAGCLINTAGCQAYQLRGVVLEHTTKSEVLVVDASDPRLQTPGIEQAVVEVILEPGEMHPAKLPPLATDEQGAFAIPIEKDGAGFLEYQVLIAARKPGFAASWKQILLPGQDKRLLIYMKPGRDDYRPMPDILQDTMKYRRLMDSE